MNRGVVQSSPVQQMMAANPNNWWNINTMRPPNSHIHHQPSPPFFSTPPSNFLTPYPPTPSSLPLPSWHDNQGLPTDSWSQLLMSGGGVLLSEEDKGGMCQQQEQIMLSQPQNADPLVDVVKQESYVYGRNQEFLQAKPTWSQIVPPPAASSPKSSTTTVTSFNSSGSMLDFSNNKTDTRSPPSDPISNSECNSGAAGGAFKKARVQPSTPQSTFKVRREKLGDRITALHQLVSPFGKTDTASVLLEAIGYIKFLQTQIEALSLPYFGSGSGNTRHQQSVRNNINPFLVQGEKNCLFPEDPGQLLNENCLKRKAASKQDSEEEEKEDLRSRGLCLVPVSCTLQVGSDNGADYWAPAFGGGFQ